MFKDDEIIKIYKEGNQHYAFNLLVGKYKEKLYYIIRRMVIDHDDADDLVQNTFIKVWEALPDFRQEASLYTWLYKIAVNESITFLNKKKKKFLIPLVNVEHALTSKLESDAYFEGSDIQMKLQKAILKLPEKQRLVFNMKYFDEMKYEEMAEVLNTSVGALKASYHIAVGKIEEFLKRD
jgi:RNA polymerase sigma factor (sigma-70 family)